MKNKIKNFLAVILIGLSYNVFAQIGNTPVTAVQGGVGHLNNGVCIINLNEPMDAAGYFVSLTPHTGGSALYVTKDNNTVTIKAKSAKRNTDFDYVIFKSLPVISPVAVIKSKVAPSVSTPAK